MLRNSHAIVGGIVLVIFLLSGLYLRNGFPEFYGESEVIRYQFRANHAYLLFAALVNLALAQGTDDISTNWRRLTRWVGSLLVLAGPLLLVGAFFIEPIKGVAARPLTVYGILAIAVGVGIRWFGSLRNPIEKH